MARKITVPISLGIITVLAIVFLMGGGTDDKDILRQTFQIEAIYYDAGYVEISYFDKSGETNSVVMEVLGMDESFQKSFSGSEFIEIIQFPNLPKYGWPIHPHIQLKTEIHPLDEPTPPVIYSRP